jgi:hypothetical protein
VVLGLVTTGLVAVSAPASAAGACYGYEPTESSWSVRCDGTRPDAYAAAAICSGNVLHLGIWEFRGSGIWSTAHCGTNSFVTYGSYFTSP